ncbi:RagB/SusD family nutrient uptake outer membrane protein [Chitinophaga agrisoli]|uniref:RagB/SusD family nutrient uptake outer membrane protein n=1 Tax=Chitinophaga agrisoli TaxID=2607653 RepID=A0A5B2VYR4_9BACT|nr:RagB/SusD family nutrient uptake outer membrane protein [Chitinophaga agrisoli]KAA2243798.1 RagB/SusD family nutrient uptake outer membrane protein [Chitinophaga agrisoli]
MKKIFPFYITAVLLLAAGCSGKLDIQNPNTPTITNFWKTEQDALAGVNTLYSTYHRVGLCRNQFFITIIRSDEGYSTSPNPTLVNNFDKFIITDYNLFETRSLWQDCFIGINRANQILDNVPAIQMDEKLKQQYLGEAKFMRALFYFYLAQYWGNVPLQLKTPQPDDHPATSPQAAVWAQVEKDLTEAAPALPITYSDRDKGRATRGAAHALLGKAFMQERKYQEAATALQWFFTGEGNGIYTLMTNYRDNFVITSENNAESVFEFQFAVNPTDNHDDDTDPNNTDNLNYGSSLPPFFAPRPIGFTDGQARRWVVNEYMTERTATNARDPRLAASFLYDSTDERGPDFSLVYGKTFSSLGYSSDPSAVPNTHDVYLRKMLNDFRDDVESFHSGNNYRYIRFADVLLLYAEALNATGQTAAAYPFVDRVRERAGLQKLSVVKPGLSQAAFLAQLKHERITELAGEGHRWEDLARWGDLGPQLAGRDPGFANFQTGKHELLPIPQQDVDVNPNLVQNPGWK